MTTFSSIERHIGQVLGELTMMLREVDQAQGRQEAFRLQHPQRLDVLTRVARIESTEASNEIEGITAPHARIEALVEETTTPRNRSEEEIAGYRKVLDLIHSTSPGSIPFTVNVVKQFHGLLYEFSPGRGGEFKQSDNEVIEELPDGTRVLRFTPVPAWQTEEAMRALHEGWAAALESGRYHPVMLTGAYVLDLLVIHPFSDGNGRMARLLTLLLLYKGGYEVGRYISLEKVIAETKETYYEALEASTSGWHEDAHDPVPWLRYFLGVLIGAYRRFEERAAALAGRGSKTEAVKQFVRSSLSDEFTIADIRRASPGVSDDHIRKVLAALRADGVIESASKGRSARYRRLRTDF
jgi:Fic family protein